MGADSKIEWCHHTFNPWWGCTRVSPGCEHCYAETFAKRIGHNVWGATAARRVFGEKHWAEPLKWNREAEAAGERRRVFCASMADVFENRIDLLGERERLWRLIEQTPWLIWLVLTKRPENFEALWPWYGCTGEGPDRPPQNIWLGVTAENQASWDRRVPLLCAAAAERRFVSAEPLLGPISIDAGYFVDWMIIGGESGGGARAMFVNWARHLLDECRRYGITPFVKQLGAKAWDDHATWDGPREPHRLRLHDPKGGDMAEWPAELRIRQFPEMR